MSEMVERVARALAWEDGSRWERLIVPDETEPYERRARAAIKLMRNPTEVEFAHATHAALARGEYQCYSLAAGTWRAMIDLALE